MKKIVSTADWHLRNCDSYGDYNSLNVNEFLLRRVKAAKEIIRASAKHNACLVNVGDFIDDVLVDGVTLYYASELIKEMSRLDNEIILLEGNHGYDGRHGEYSAIKHWSHLAKKNIHIVTKPEIVIVDDIEFHCIPAISDVDRLFQSIVNEFLSRSSKLNTKKVLLFHGPIINARFDNNMPAKSGVKREYISWVSKVYNYVICGDFHRHQFIRKNVWYTGSPIQTSLKDKYQDKGYQIIDLDRDTVEFKRLDGPKFIEIHWIVGEQICPLLSRPQDFHGTLKDAIVVVHLMQKADDSRNVDSMIYRLKDHGALKIFIDKKMQAAQKNRISIDVDMSIEQIVDSYAEHRKQELPSRKHKVIETGLRYLR